MSTSKLPLKSAPVQFCVANKGATGGKKGPTPGSEQKFQLQPNLGRS